MKRAALSGWVIPRIDSARLKTRQLSACVDTVNANGSAGANFAPLRELGHHLVDPVVLPIDIAA